MGCTEDQGDVCNFYTYAYELPVHWVTLSDFYIGKYEVTQKQWRDVMGTDIYHQCKRTIGRDCTSLDIFGEGDNYPMYYVSWDDVQEFIDTLNGKTGMNYRLPTEAEWEYAARGGKESEGYMYSGSNDPDDVAWFRFHEDFPLGTRPVGTKMPNELGLYDMSGNVWEWVQDWFDVYSDSPQKYPQGPASPISDDTGRVAGRGGHWASWAYKQVVPPIVVLESYTELIRVSVRAASHSANPGSNICGFRLARNSE